MSFEFIRLMVTLSFMTVMRMAKNAGVFLWGGKQLIQSPKLGFKLLGSFVAFLCLLTWPMMRLVRDTGGGLFGHKQMRGMSSKTKTYTVVAR
jgi:hypothetical protein